jgi:D-glycero-D-manno-heptose 1,7-bisphosphate phosphatase
MTAERSEQSRRSPTGSPHVAPAHGTGRAAVFLDRDGVLNDAIIRDGRPAPPMSVDEVVIRDGVREACERLSGAGFLLIVVTNQPDIARRNITWETVDAINRHLTDQLSLDVVYVCAHDDADACSCRKPAPGLLLDAAARIRVDLSRSVMVGDRWRDIEAGKRAGVATVWVRSDYCEAAPEAPDHIVDGLLDVVPLVTSSPTAEEGSRR